MHFERLSTNQNLECYTGEFGVGLAQLQKSFMVSNNEPVGSYNLHA